MNVLNIFTPVYACHVEVEPPPLDSRRGGPGSPKSRDEPGLAGREQPFVVQRLDDLGGPPATHLQAPLQEGV